MVHLINRIKEEKRPIRFLMSRLLWKTRACMLFRINISDSWFIRFYPTALSATLWVDQDTLNEEDIFFHSYLRKNDCVVDIGANIGYLTLVAASIVGTEGKVYSVEANPNTYKYLKNNIDRNHCLNVQSFNLAIGDINKSVKITDDCSDDMNKVILYGKGLTIEQKRLDDLAIVCEMIHLLKIDVEGYEKFVIDGAQDALKKTVCVYFEYWQRHFDNFDYSGASIIRSLREQGFEIHRIDRNNRLLSVGDNYESENCENMVAIRDIDEFQKRMTIKAGI